MEIVMAVNQNNLGGSHMKVRSSVIASLLAASVLAPTVGTAIANQTTNSTPAVSVQKADHAGHHVWGKGEKQKELTNIINQYATPQLKEQLTKDLATRKSLMKQFRQTPGFQKKKEQRQAFYKAHKQEIDAIKQQVKDGKLTKKQAHQKLEALFGKQKGKNQFNDKRKGMHVTYRELKAAIQKNDKTAINAALEKMHQQLQSSNQQLQKKIDANK
jgi:hypothetical protein